jgi:hypothetical protein
VWIGKSSYNKVTHNEISNFDYSGISCGWSWGFQPSSAHHNNLDYNHIHHLGNGDGLSDMGGIYTLGLSPGTTERYNHIHHVYSYAHVSHGSGVYPDEGSSEILIENNVVHRVRTCPLFQHYGKENTVRNNIFAFGEKAQLQRCREDKRCHYAAEGNIVLGEIEPMLGGVWKSGDWKLARNVYWCTDGTPDFAGRDFDTWQEQGNDAGSIVADPLFVDAASGDFRLQPHSPALKLGFQPIDLSNTGLYGDPDWVALPKQYPNRPLNEIPAPVEPPFLVNFDFEAQPPGSEPLDLQVIDGGKPAALVISADMAASGTQSLVFRDAPELRHGFMPHLCCKPSYETGKVRLSWDMLNSREAPADFYVELRQWDVDPYRVGPTVSVTPEGEVIASGRRLGQIPLGQWAHVEIELELGKDKPKTYRLKLTAPNQEAITAELPFRSEGFERITWLGISSNSRSKTVFYIDNLKLGTPEELEKPPKRRRPARAAQQGPREPANDQQLMGCWTFDEDQGYVAVDSSGYGNDGDVWGTWAEGPFGGAISFDSEYSHVQVPDDPTLQFGKSDFSIALWIHPKTLEIDSADRRRRFMSKSGRNRTWWNLNVTTEGTPFLEMLDAEGASGTTRATGTIPAGAWTHFAVVVDRDQRKVRYFLNGEVDSVKDLSPKFTGPLDVKGSELLIGSQWQPLIGMLDDVKIYKRTLSAEEIAADFQRTKAAHSR